MRANGAARASPWQPAGAVLANAAGRMPPPLPPEALEEEEDDDDGEIRAPHLSLVRGGVRVSGMRGGSDSGGGGGGGGGFVPTLAGVREGGMGRARGDSLAVEGQRIRDEHAARMIAQEQERAAAERAAYEAQQALDVQVRRSPSPSHAEMASHVGHRRDQRRDQRASPRPHGTHTHLTGVAQERQRRDSEAAARRAAEEAERAARYEAERAAWEIAEAARQAAEATDAIQQALVTQDATIVRGALARYAGHVTRVLAAVGGDGRRPDAFPIRVAGLMPSPLGSPA